jgi:SHS2 domain-containing protein
MSFWLRPTTADIGLRAFSSSPERLLIEAAKGMQSIMLSKKGETSVASGIRKTGVWNLTGVEEGDWERWLVLFLQEVLYKSEVENMWLVDGAIKITDAGMEIVVSWIEGDEIELEVEIKAVTMHELLVQQVPAGIAMNSPWPEVPSFEGPGWVGDVVFDI